MDVLMTYMQNKLSKKPYLEGFQAILYLTFIRYHPVETGVASKISEIIKE